MDLAQRSLDINPTNAVASHSMTHVHLSWHLALFELAQGKYQETLDRYEKFIRPSVIA
jgi:hypothetical protein